MPAEATVRVPASTSNLGSGFDCVGVAVDRWLTASVALGGADGVRIRREGTLARLSASPEDDLLFAGFAAACASVGRPVPAALEFGADSGIPVARGLGSSAAAFVAGARLASDALELGLAAEAVADLCAAAEGHPDNAAPAALGGAVLGVPREDGGYLYARLTVHPGLALVFAVPEFEVRTSAARAVLPASVSFSTAVAAAGRAAALIQGLATGDPGLLARALDDVLHVPHRRGLVAGFSVVDRAARGAGAVGVTLSGSGSTLMAFSPERRADGVLEAMMGAWRSAGVQAEGFVSRRPVGAASGGWAVAGEG